MSTLPPTPTRADLARELLLYKMEEYSEDFACASWLVDLEFELWGYGDIASTAPEEEYSIRLGKELRTLSEIAGGWWVFGDGVPPHEHRMFMPLERWLVVLAERDKK